MAAAALQFRIAIVAELADAHGSGPCTRKGVGVRVPSSAPLLQNPNEMGVFLRSRSIESSSPRLNRVKKQEKVA